MPLVNTLLRNKMLNDVLGNFLYCDLYSGPLPSSGDSPTSGVLLASWNTLAWDFNPDTSLGSASLIVPNNSSPAIASGTGGYVRISQRSTPGVPGVYNQSIYAEVSNVLGQSDVTLSTLNITVGAVISILAMTIYMPERS